MQCRKYTCNQIILTTEFLIIIPNQTHSSNDDVFLTYAKYWFNPVSYSTPPTTTKSQRKSMTGKLCKFSPGANNRNSQLNKFNSFIAPEQWNIIHCKLYTSPILDHPLWWDEDLFYLYKHDPGKMKLWQIVTNFSPINHR